MAESTAFGVRVAEADAVRIDWAAEIRGVSRSRFVAEAAAREARRTLEDARDEDGEDDGEADDG